MSYPSSIPCEPILDFSCFLTETWWELKRKSPLLFPFLFSRLYLHDVTFFTTSTDVILALKAKTCIKRMSFFWYFCFSLNAMQGLKELVLSKIMGYRKGSEPAYTFLCSQIHHSSWLTRLMDAEAVNLESFLYYTSPGMLNHMNKRPEDARIVHAVLSSNVRNLWFLLFHLFIYFILLRALIQNKIK